jgi:hypothetical protein
LSTPRARPSGQLSPTRALPRRTRAAHSAASQPTALRDRLNSVQLRGTQASGAKRVGWTALCLAVVAAALLNGCVGVAQTPRAVECQRLPEDPRQTLSQAWEQYQPDRALPFSIPVRRRLFALQVLLISAGMYDDPPSDPATVYAEYASQFVRDFGMSRNPGLATALEELNQTFQQDRERPESDLSNNCGLILARRMLRDDAVDVSTDWVLQTITWGFAPTFQQSIQQLVSEDAHACSSEPAIASVPESVLACTMRRVGL